MASPSPAREIARLLLERAVEEVRREAAACGEEDSSSEDSDG